MGRGARAGSTGAREARRRSELCGASGGGRAQRRARLGRALPAQDQDAARGAARGAGWDAGRGAVQRWIGDNRSVDVSSRA